jgi:hypothetical protein
MEAYKPIDEDGEGNDVVNEDDNVEQADVETKKVDSNDKPKQKARDSL